MGEEEGKEQPFGGIFWHGYCLRAWILNEVQHNQFHSNGRPVCGFLWSWDTEYWIICANDEKCARCKSDMAHLLARWLPLACFDQRNNRNRLEKKTCCAFDYACVFFPNGCNTFNASVMFMKYRRDNCSRCFATLLLLPRSQLCHVVSTWVLQNIIKAPRQNHFELRVEENNRVINSHSLGELGLSTVLKWQKQSVSFRLSILVTFQSPFQAPFPPL